MDISQYIYQLETEALASEAGQKTLAAVSIASLLAGTGMKLETGVLDLIEPLIRTVTDFEILQKDSSHTIIGILPEEPTDLTNQTLL